MKRKCFFSVLNSDFIEGFKVFCSSLIRHNSWLKETETELLIVPIDLSLKQKSECEKFYPHIKWIEGKIPPKNLNFEKLNIGISAFHKLQAFSISDYDLVISIDCGDMLINGSVAELFSYDVPIGMIQGWTKSHGWHDQKKAGGTFNGGLVLLNKKYRNEEVYKELIAQPQSAYYDQQIINDYFFKKISKLPVYFNFSKRLIENKELEPEEARIIHFVGEKPWQKRYKGKILYKTLEEKWHKELNSCKF